MKKHFKGNNSFGLMTLVSGGMLIVRRTNKYGSSEATALVQTFVPGVVEEDLGHFLMHGEAFCDPERDELARLESYRRLEQMDRERSALVEVTNADYGALIA